MIGREALAYHGTAGTGIATLLIAGVRDVNWTIECSAIESVDRDSIWKTKKAGFLSGSGSLEVTYDPTDASHQALDSATEAGTKIALKFLDSAAGAGMIADVVFSSGEQSDPLEEAVTRTYNFEFDGTITAVA